MREDKGLYPEGYLRLLSYRQSDYCRALWLTFPPFTPDTLAMGEIPVTRAHLESLTTSDLIRMADGFGIDIPPDLDRIFIIEELLEIAASGGTGDTGDFSVDLPPEDDLADSGLVESVPLPRQYNITFVEVIIRDPFWAFVFWEIKTQDKEHFEKIQDFEGYYLKVSPWGLAAKPDAEGVFTVQISQNDAAWYLGLSPAIEQSKPPLSRARQYKVELCAGAREGEAVLAVSSPFALPLLHEAPTGRDYRLFAAENPLVMLSGYEDFDVVRKN